MFESQYLSDSTSYQSDGRAEAQARHPESAEANNQRPRTPPLRRQTEPANFGRSPQVVKPHADRINHDFFKKARKVKAEKVRATLAMELYKAIHLDITSLYDDVVQDSPPFDPRYIMKRITIKKQPRRKTATNYIQNKRQNEWNGWPDTNKQGTEDELCLYLNKIADHIRRVQNKPQSDDDLIFSSAFKDRGPQTGHTTDRKPDLVVIPRGQKDATWADFRCVASLKIENQGRTKECAQIMEYARCCFSKRPDRRYVLGLGFLHNNLSFYVFDRSGILATPYYNVNQHPEQFLRLAISILFMDNAQLGYDTSFYRKDGRNYIRAGGEEYKILRKLYIDKTLRGRGTVCLKATDKAGKVVVIKDSWVDRTRATKEVDMLRRLEKLGIENTPTLYSDEIVLFPGDTTRKDCTENFRRKKILEELKDKDRGQAYRLFRGTEIRDHYRIVQGPYGEPLDDFDSLPELLSAAYDIFGAIEFLNEKKIVHRDVSLNNIILVSQPGSRLRKGYLIDFDFAIGKYDEAEAAIGPRTGTIAFMAIDILRREVKHSFIHDTESMVYILIFLSCHQGGPHHAVREDGFEFENSILGEWCPVEDVDEMRLMAISRSKGEVMKDKSRFQTDVIKSMSAYFKPLRKCFLRMRKALFPPSPDDSDDESDDETPNNDEIERRRAIALKKVKNVVHDSWKELEEEEARVKIASGNTLASSQDGEPKCETLLDANDTNADGDSSTVSLNDSGSVTGKPRDRTNLYNLRLRDVMVAPDDPRRIAAYLDEPEAQPPTPAPEPTHPLQTRFKGASLPAQFLTQSLGKRSREVDAIPVEHFYGSTESFKKSRVTPSWTPSMQSLGE